MPRRLKDAVSAGVGKVLTRRGFEGIELDLARGDAIAWAKTRRLWVQSGRRTVVGRAVVVTSPGRAQLRPIERALAGPGEITVEVLASAVSPGTERAEWLRLPNLQRPFPYTPGYSGAGRVISCGDGPDMVEPGTVVAVARMPHASVATMPAAYACVVPEGVSIEAAALLYLAVISGYGVQRAGALADEPVCVIGAGPIGALAQRMAMLERPGPVTVVASSRRREAAAIRAGAAQFRSVDDGVGDLQAAVVIEATGDPRAINAAVSAARPGGRVVLLGSPWDVTDDVPVGEIQRKGLRVVGAHISALATAAKTMDHDPFRMLGERFLGALAEGALVVDDLVGEAIDPREIQHFYRRLANGDVTTAHLNWTALPLADRMRRPRLLELPELRSERPLVADVRPTPAPARSGTLRFAIVGCGDIGYKNARAVFRSAHGELGLLFDPVDRLSAEAAAQFGGAAVGTLDEALDPSRVDAVILSVPHDLHTPLVERATKAGLHVIVEKPISNDLQGAVRAIEAATDAGVVLSVCLPYRYEPSVVAARALVAAGGLGDARGAAVVFHDDQSDAYWWGGFSGRALSDWRLQRRRAGGGVLIMSLIHYIDFVRYVLGVEIASVTATAFTKPGFEVEDEISLAVTFENGGVATFFGSTSTRGRPPVKVEMWGDTGTILLQPEPAFFTERAIDGVTANRWCDLPPDDGRDVRAIFVERFVEAVTTGTPPDVPAGEGLAAQAVIEAGYRSLDTGGVVTISDVMGSVR
jgi:2-desacetyl-2-hydroxyethyl bacteriochlorophyllide A dehydrogenase